jgi:hypothetical protein
VVSGPLFISLEQGRKKGADIEKASSHNYYK